MSAGGPERHLVGTCSSVPVGEGSVVAKKVLTWIAVAFAVFYVLAKPTEAAAAVESAGAGLRVAGDAIATFFTALAN